MAKLVLIPKRWKIVSITFSQLLLQTWLTNYLLVLIYFTRNLQLFRIFIIAKKVQADEFMLIPVSEDFICKELCTLNPSKSTGTDNIPARLVKDAASVLTKPIVHIINLSIK